MTRAQQIFEAILSARGIKDVESFSKPRYESLGDPFLLPDMKKAIKRIEAAKNRGESVAVYGDYDVDGMSATSLLIDAFSQIGIRAESFIPDRFKDGYGLSKRGVDELAGKGVSLFVTVDTGSLSHELIEYAKQHHNIDVIVTDHHSLGDDLPPAVAVINPKRKDSKYPFKELAGVGVAFTLVRGMQKAGLGPPQGQEKWLLDLVALGTVCDIVPLTGENRTLVYWGLRVMAKTKRPGLAKLIERSDIDLGEITTTSIGYRLGPRLNASGRLSHAQRSLDLLTTSNLAEAEAAAIELDNLNSQRRQQQDEITKQALAMAEERTDENVHIFVHPEWSHGIVGIVASKLVESTGKPVFVLQQLGDIAKGSARSFGDFHLADAINASRHLIESGGGHAFAAGVSVKMERLDAFKESISSFYNKLNLQRQESYLKAKHDIHLHDIDGLNLELIELLRTLEPFGSGHEQPLFKLSNVTLVEWRGVGQDGKHAKITVADSRGEVIDGIGFGLSTSMPEISSIVSITTSLEANTFRGNTKPQLVIKDIVKYDEK